MPSYYQRFIVMLLQISIFVLFWENRLDIDILHMQLRFAERCCLLQREEAAGGSQVGKYAGFNTVWLP